MAEFIVNAEVRNKIGKGDSKKLRAKNQIPGVIYGKDFTPVHIALSRTEFEKVYSKCNRNSIIQLKLGGAESREVIVRDKQKDAISHAYTHIDFQAIQKNVPIRVEVDLEFTGTPIGRKSGGVFTTMCKQVRIECLPDKIPQVIQLDITDLDAGQSLHVSDIKAGNFKVVTNQKIALCQISQVKDEAEEGAPAAAAAGAAAPAAAAAAPAAPAKGK
ncbi:MAG: 50S ribosomal protein L25 [Candidatus Riflebacteria bacterium]